MVLPKPIYLDSKDGMGILPRNTTGKRWYDISMQNVQSSYSILRWRWSQNHSNALSARKS